MIGIAHSVYTNAGVKREKTIEREEGDPFVVRQGWASHAHWSYSTTTAGHLLHRYRYLMGENVALTWQINGKSC
ncbi:hypothetical protein EGR_09280 [Echinococcus granulosus]|uniref:Uncharacterized protein n=1 Tax=Echinococcus granulosus TaxID=6210 RepID=W6UBR4_ECHGR|nr:hypothetical protein EGR_09280 [Echinococcus granulosus]EUB55877.1 hypothetical protein EGR_09280 [Echinococcus granulosus]